MIYDKGTLVEITMEGEHFGKRFVIDQSHVTDALYDDSGKIIDHNVRVYHAPFDFSLPGMPKMICCYRAKDLRRVNPDGDALSNDTFSEMLSTLKKGRISSESDNGVNRGVVLSCFD
tara:strand:- start:14339 stop:14689 length:351 start_codon:yes stop_codon:yes gene_type:complete